MPHTPSGALDYSAISRAPVRGALVEAVDDTGAVRASGATDVLGRYQLSVPGDTRLRVRAHARMLRTGTPAWDFRVVDNTSAGAGYALESAPFSSGSGNRVVDLHAASGWDGSRYASTRSAAPFAILDTVYDSFQKILPLQPAIQFPPLTLNWSPANRASENFNPAAGEIITTAYFFVPLGEIFVLGDEDSDTDEYDAHVVAHEFAHYLEDRLGRNDSPGGEHGLFDVLDPRLAFSEGWASAWSGIATGSPFYRDAFGARQASGSGFNIDQNQWPVAGWYNEASILSVLYDLFDGVNEELDSVTLGLTPLWEVFTGAGADTEALTTIFSYYTPLKAGRPQFAANMDLLLEQQQIRAVDMDIWGSTETNDAGNQDVLPVYTEVVPDGLPVTICTTADFGIRNKLSVRRFARVPVAGAGDYGFTLSGQAGTDPDMAVFRRGLIALSQSEDDGVESFDLALQAGVHVVALWEFKNVVPTPDPSDAFPGRHCFDLSVVRR